MLISVTAEDIKEGRPRLPHKCPIARAATRETGRTCLVGTRTFKCGFDPYIRLPKKARDFVRNFDAGKKVKPISFRIKGIETC